MTEFAAYSVQRYAELELDGQPCFYEESHGYGCPVGNP
jgi:hypothetical protein